MNFWDERNPARAAIMHELNQSTAKEIVGYCARLGSYRLILMADQYGDKADVVQLVEWLLSKGVVVVMSDTIRDLKNVPGYSNEYLDELRGKLTVANAVPVVSSAERIASNEKIKDKIRRDKKVQE